MFNRHKLGDSLLKSYWQNNERREKSSKVIESKYSKTNNLQSSNKNKSVEIKNLSQRVFSIGAIEFLYIKLNNEENKN